MTNRLLHRFDKSLPIEGSRLNSPFYYTPSLINDVMVREAVKQIKDMIANHAEWCDEVALGKMFGVLVVEDTEGHIGFLAAYSGQIGGKEDWEGFVPAVFDYLQPDGYFAVHEREISDINHQMDVLLNDSGYLSALEVRQSMEVRHLEEVAAFQAEMREAKKRRDDRRATATTEETAAMIRESQWMKAELRRIKRRHQSEVGSLEKRIKEVETEASRLRKERKQKSDDLQRWLFSHFVMCNALGEKRDLLEIFAHTPQGVPPSGAGECCAPKLLQFAFLHGLKPLRIAEFWQGASPKGEIRHHNHFYPACRSKCLPILDFMLQGLEVEPNPLEEPERKDLEIVYDDDHIVVVNKPSGMLAVPGKTARESVYSILRQRYPQAEGPMIVHRLDMATSGLMVAAKTMWVYHALQRQFEQHEVKKRYVALLERDISKLVPTRGTISLPLRPDMMDHPRQVVDKIHGKEAITDYEILGVENGHTLIALYPHTGRTHQLRVHCAHPEGLGCPILGDALYGTPADRLHLHAKQLTFTHPITGEKVQFIIHTTMD
ncbi:MAG: RluA family pseudouridine synthase [Prevotella sp.]|nr:RluA family pseudouridine synthase [Prevotella sp.]